MTDDTRDWKGFDFDSIWQEAAAMFDEHNRQGVRISGMMRQDSLNYWIAVVAWQRAKAEIVTPDEFVKRFIENWTAELARQGIEYKDFERSNIRLLARVIAETFIGPKEK